MTAESFRSEDYLDNVEGIVEGKFSEATNYADLAWNIAEGLISEMSTAAANWNFDWPMWGCNIGGLADVSPPTQPAKVDLGDLGITLPTCDPLEAITIEDIDIPACSVVSPIITIPEEPSGIVWPRDPGEPPNLTYPEKPTKPNYSLPSLPRLDDLVIPPPSSLDIPVFDGVLPVDDVDLPSTIFIYDEAVYESVLRDAVRESLLDTVQNGGTGLGATIEDAIWERAKARRELELEAMYDEAEEYFASRGFSLPTGALSSRLAAIQLENERSKQQINYEIMIEQARLAQTNTHFAITSAIQQEQTIMTFVSEVANRALDAAKYAQEAAIALFNAAAAKYNLKLNAYQVSASVFESRIRAAGLVLEHYRAQLEGVQIAAGIQKLQVELYGVQVAAVETLMNIYRTEAEVVKILSDIERIKLEGFLGKVNVHGARLNAITSRYNAWQAQIAGEEAKAKVYESQIRGYLGEVEGAKVQGEVNIMEASARIEKNKSLIEKFKSDLVRYTSEASVILGRLEAEGRLYGYDVDMYKADVGFAGVKVQRDAEEYKLRIEHCKNFNADQLERVKIKLDEAMKIHEIQVEALKSGASVSAQMAASALASASAAAQLSYRGAYDRQDSVIQQTNYTGE